MLIAEYFSFANLWGGRGRDCAMNKYNANSERKGVNHAILGMGIVYAFFLVWAILWKCGIPFIGDGSERTINLLPFNGNTRWELEFNVAVFMPFGFCLAAVMRKLTLPKLVLATLTASLVLETIQFALAVGRSDVTDLLMNIIGGVIGIAAHLVLSKLSGKNERKVTLAACVPLTLLEVYMTISFILFGQLNIGFMIIRI
jgi:glycopeptide antibiotics resistance protein